MIVNPGGGNVRMPEPFLDFGDVGLVVECVCGGRRPQRMRADLEAERCRIGPHQLINAVGGDRRITRAGGVVLDRPEQRAAFVASWPAAAR